MQMSDFTIPTMVQGVGMGLVFPNLSASALTSIPREQMGYAASLYSMTRNIGGSIGTSVLTTLLVRKEQMMQSHLVEHVTAFDAWRMSNAQNGLPGAMHFNYMNQLVTGQKQGLAMVYGVVQGQAMMMSLNQIYRSMAGVIVVALLLCLMLPRPRGRAPAGAAH
jgi:DHA2 family multidrug resistance protein